MVQMDHTLVTLEIQAVLPRMDHTLVTLEIQAVLPMGCMGCTLATEDTHMLVVEDLIRQTSALVVEDLSRQTSAPREMHSGGR